MDSGSAFCYTWGWGVESDRVIDRKEKGGGRVGDGVLGGFRVGGGGCGVVGEGVAGKRA